MATWFDESRLDDERVLAAPTRPALAGRVRRPGPPRGRRRRRGDRRGGRRQQELARPRAVIAAGPDSRLLRAVLEPSCPVPFVAWPGPALPGWAGSLDLVVCSRPTASDAGAASAVAEAVRRGCQVVVACPPTSMVAEHAAGR